MRVQMNGIMDTQKADGEGQLMGNMLDTNTHHGGAGHSSSVRATAELSGKETRAPPPREGWC